MLRVGRSHTVNQWNPGTIRASFADTLQVTLKEFGTSNFEAFLDYLRSKLVHTILCSVAEDVIDCTDTVSWSSVLADMLNAPVAELTVGDDVDTGEDFVDAWALICRSTGNAYSFIKWSFLPCLPRDNSQRCSERPNCRSLQEQRHATCRGEPRLHTS